MKGHVHYIEHDLAENPVGETVWIASAVAADRLKLMALLECWSIFNDRHPE